MPSWLTSLTIAETAGLLVAAGGLIAGLRWLLPIMRGVHDFLSDWSGEPARAGRARRPGVIERLATMERVQTTMERVQGEHGEKIEGVLHQVENTHSTNLRADIDCLSAAIAEVKAAVERSVDDRRDLHGAIDRLDQTIREHHPREED